mmetsp:Transcript_28107/g.71116  ORF Transcript_28107/g.71116 Transcript_28107/m.71116 type:complete len:215 (+) Transcript_28107:209-853(+)
MRNEAGSAIGSSEFREESQEMMAARCSSMPWLSPAAPAFVCASMTEHMLCTLPVLQRVCAGRSAMSRCSAHGLGRAAPAGLAGVSATTMGSATRLRTRISTAASAEIRWLRGSMSAAPLLGARCGATTSALISLDGGLYEGSPGAARAAPAAPRCGMDPLAKCTSDGNVCSIACQTTTLREDELRGGGRLEWGAASGKPRHFGGRRAAPRPAPP